MKWLIKYATRGRPNLFRQRLENIKNTITNQDYEIIVSIDNDDHYMTDSFCKDIERDYKVRIFKGNSVSKIHAINRDMDKVEQWDYLINFSDDMEFAMVGWDAIMEKDFKDTWGESTDFFAHYNDGYLKNKLPTMAIMGYDYYKRFDYIYHPDYKSFSCDAEQMYVAMMIGRYKYFNKILFMHQHPANNKSVTVDSLYRRNDAFVMEDADTYFKRLRKGFYVKKPVCIPIPFNYPNPNERK